MYDDGAIKLRRDLKLRREELGLAILLLYAVMIIETDFTDGHDARRSLQPAKQRNLGKIFFGDIIRMNSYRASHVRPVLAKRNTRLRIGHARRDRDHP